MATNPRAIEAAEAIDARIDSCVGATLRPNISEIAAIIEKKTGLDELVKALKLAASEMEHGCDCELLAGGNKCDCRCKELDDVIAKHYETNQSHFKA